MKITFLGTGHGVPSATRACSSTMIKLGNAIYLVDAGAAVVDKMMQAGEDVTDVKAVFTTHAHSDHVAGVYHLADLYNWKYRDSEIDIYLTEKRVADAIDELISATTRNVDRERVRLHAVTKDFKYSDHALTAVLYPTEHLTPLNRPSYGIMIEAEGKKIYFSGDLSQHLALDDFPTWALEPDIDIFVCELAHFSIDKVKPYLDKCKAKRVVFTHIYPIEKYDELEKMKKDYAFELILPEDMDSITL